MKALSTLSDFRDLLKESAREASLLGLAVLIVLALAGFSLWLNDYSSKRRLIAAELNQFNAKLILLGQELRKVESRQRGYVITEKKDLAILYHESSSKLVPMLNELLASAPKIIQVEDELASIFTDLRKKVNEMTETVTLVEKGLKSQAIARIGDLEGFTLTANIEDRLQSVRNKASSLINNNDKSIKSLENVKLIVEVLGAFIVLSFSMISLILLLRSNANIRTAQETVTKAKEELENLVEQRTAALKRANDEIQRFAYIVSHDLRSPLVNIMGFTSELETLRKELFQKIQAAEALEEADTISKDFDEALGFIKSSISRMDRLINAILRISREGNRPLNAEIIDMKDLIDTLTKAVAHQIREKDVTIEVMSLPKITTDRLAMEQIFSNLLENAIKFLEPGKVGTIKFEGREHFNDILYSITDNGRGIDPRDHGRIFELFRRSGPQNVPGEGMGLAFVSALARKLGGTIDVTSNVGVGSTFTLRFPKNMPVQKRLAA